MSAQPNEKSKILLVDDDKNILKLISVYLSKEEPYEIQTATNSDECFDQVEKFHPDIVLLDIQLPGISGMEILDRIRKFYPAVPIIMMSAHGTVEIAVESMKVGAYDFVTKPFDYERLKVVIRNALMVKSLSDELNLLKSELYQQHDYGSIIGRSGKMQSIYASLNKIAASANVTVLVMGESGTGKELVAKELHKRTATRAENSFVAVNCAALPETLLESELFGHEKGAFTGAAERRIGKFELANGGTLFLDEIGEMTPSTQAKLIRALQEREFTRIGGNNLIKVDVRVVSATNKNLEMAVADGSFREDLYYRLSVFPLILPSLRERKSDIPLLAAHFLEKFRKRESQASVESISAEALDILMHYNWPGNVRELENTIERALVVATGKEITPADLPQMIRTMGEKQLVERNLPEIDVSGTLEEIIERIESKVIQRVYDECDGNVSELARRLGIGRATLYRKAEKYQLPIKG